MTSHPDHHCLDFCPWPYTEGEPDESQRAAQREWQAQLAQDGRAVFGEGCFVSPLAGVFPQRLELGDRCYIGARVRAMNGREHMGLRGIALWARTLQAVARDHRRRPFDDLHTPISQQPLTSEGIIIGDDVWIGTHVTVVDGVKIGSHSVLAAGSVVTKDVAQYNIVGGNPARVLRDRLGGTRPLDKTLGRRLEEFGRRARQQCPAVLQAYVGANEHGACYLNQPGARPSVRAWCDALEIAAMFGGAPELIAIDELTRRLQSFQDPDSGLLPDPWSPPDPAAYRPDRLSDDLARYNILAVGYALELLGAILPYPIHAVEAMPVETLYRTLDSLPWETAAWDCGDWIDSYSTAIYFNAKYFGSQKTIEPLLGWLIARADRFSGMWGKPKLSDGWLQPVNGHYRLSRGTFAQFGLPVPYPEAAIDTLLAHSRDTAFFRADRGNACNVLDVTHGLWLCGKQTNYRRAEAQDWARAQLDRALANWIDGQGFSFELERSDPFDRQSSLQGTEMWLAIIYLSAALLGESEALGYRPRGVHRLEPIWLI